MSKHQKALQLLFSKPKGYKWNDLCSILIHLGFKQLEGDGSRVRFFNKETDTLIILHKPHPGNTVKEYVIKDVVKKLKKTGVKP